MDKPCGEEIRSVKSLDDLKNLNRKLLFLIYRAKGDFMKGTSAPPSLQIEPTNNCNLRCICCSGYSNERKRGYMDFGLFRRIIDEAADIGVKRIHLYLHGEPLLHPEDRRDDTPHQVEATGRHAGDERDAPRRGEDRRGDGRRDDERGLHPPVRPRILRQTHEKIQRGVNHDRVVANIAGLMEYRRAHKLKGPLIETVLYRMPENRGEEDDYRAYWQKRVDNARIARESTQYAELREGVSSVQARTQTCHHLWERMSIHWNGNVALCVADIDGKYSARQPAGQLDKGPVERRADIPDREFHRSRTSRPYPSAAPATGRSGALPGSACRAAHLVRRADGDEPERNMPKKKPIFSQVSGSLQRLLRRSNGKKQPKTVCFVYYQHFNALIYREAKALLEQGLQADIVILRRTRREKVFQGFEGSTSMPSRRGRPRSAARSPISCASSSST